MAGSGEGGCIDQESRIDADRYDAYTWAERHVCNVADGGRDLIAFSDGHLARCPDTRIDCFVWSHTLKTSMRGPQSGKICARDLSDERKN